MKKAVKGALFSGLVYPGLGQMVLGRPVSGLAFIAGATTGIGLIIYKIKTAFSLIMEQTTMALETQGMDFSRLFQISININESGSWLVNSGPTILFFCWLGSIIHAYLVGRRMDQMWKPADFPPEPPPVT